MPEQTAERMKILVVDDDPAFLEFVCLRLKSTGYEVDSCSEGREAIRLAKEIRPNILLLDIMMPVVHGYEVCRALRADAALAAMKIVMVSAKGYKSDIDSAKAAGADEYLVKPFDAEMLDEVVKRLMTTSNQKQDGKR